MASSSSDPDSLVTLRFHDFRVERMRHWWTLLGEDDHADIVGIFGKFPPFMRLQVDRGLLEALASFWDPTHCCFSIGEGPRSNRCLEKYLGLTTAVLRPEIARPEATWRKANISLDLLTKYFSRSAFPARLARDFIAGKKEWKKFRINAFKIAFAGRGGPDVLHAAPSSSGSAVTCSIFYRLQTPYHFERHTVHLGGQQSWMPWTHCALFDGVPLPGVWGCTGYYPSLALRQFGGVQYPPRLGDLDAVTFRLHSLVRICGGSSPGLRTSGEGRLSEMVLIEEGSPGDSSYLGLCRVERGVDPLFHSQAYSTARCTSYSFDISLLFGYQPPLVSLRELLLWSESLRRLRQSCYHYALLGRLRGEASAARVESLRSTLHHNKSSSRFLRMLRNSWRRTLAEAREQLETEQAERTRVQDELDSLRSYTQALVDPATGRPQDIVALRRALDASEEALTSARTSMGVMRVQISVLQGDNGEGFPVVTSLHQINQVMDSLGARARAVWEEHDEGDPALSTALGRFCRETCIRLGH
uniref:Aminotransferase-like plant mobile domain-containing protein n=1 Tax=Fagus sylvatica TaxID=28930 RepID=A0A2N9FTI9_FAGSY